ncbi:Uncharacterised protein [BD1-7 clade bacterium]|uniref:Replicative DNA helicase n=1 Tax=BD1-7 clade bacterium TaxID=2029982 RepID=A0A5S9NZ40_9GAMM|nr:Uncharacterised protein [BD1-7 clade bacterium]CAA0096177.1 Uncharacterised protein [BD1-7 clade bacterium]
MNTKIFEQVHSLATDMLAAAESENSEQFSRLYQELQSICFDNEDDESKNHPVQWETLADFTEDAEEALRHYKKALGFADEIGAKDYKASICYAQAMLLADEERLDEARSAIEEAQEYSNGLSDQELLDDIAELSKALEG